MFPLLELGYFFFFFFPVLCVCLKRVSAYFFGSPYFL